MAKSQNREASTLQLPLLLVGIDESGFFYLRDLLARIRHGQVSLDRAQSWPDVLTCLSRVAYSLILCDYQPGEGLALRLLGEISRRGDHIPVAFLSDHVDEDIVCAAVHASSAARTLKSGVDEFSVSRALCFALDLYCKERQRRTAEDTLRKLWRAVEQTADLIMIADRSGTVEYVNPAFETVTGYSRHEALGRNLRLLKPRQMPPAVIGEMWATVMSGSPFQGTVLNRKKKWRDVCRRKRHHSAARPGR